MLSEQFGRRSRVNKPALKGISPLTGTKLFHSVSSTQKVSKLVLRDHRRMQNTTLLQFPGLTELATYIKAVHPDAYIINTLKLTVLASLTEFEIALAVEQYGGMFVEQNVTA